MQDPNLNPERLTLGKPVFVRLVPLVLCWVIIYFLIHMGINKYKDVSDINYKYYIMRSEILPTIFIADNSYMFLYHVSTCLNINTGVFCSRRSGKRNRINVSY